MILRIYLKFHDLPSPRRAVQIDMNTIKRQSDNILGPSLEFSQPAIIINDSNRHAFPDSIFGRDRSPAMFTITLDGNVDLRGWEPLHPDNIINNEHRCGITKLGKSKGFHSRRK